MIKIIAVVVVLFSVSSVSAQTFVESQNQITGAGVIPIIDAQLEIPGKSANLYGWFQVSQTWGEALVGMSKQINPVLWAAIAVGVETDEHPWRVSPSAFVSKNRVSVFVTTEHGGSGFWYKSTGTVRLISRLEAGYHTQRFYGTGPMLKLNLDHKLAIWGSVVKDSAMLGVIKTF